MNADTDGGPSPSQRITHRIADLADWRGSMIARLRDVIRGADPDITEEWKWDSPVWACDGLICSAGAFKDHVKVHFFKGASLDDPTGLFNAGLEGKTMRAIDFREGDGIDATALAGLVRVAIAHNRSKGAKK